MAKIYKTPGVYVEELPSLAPAVIQSDTAIPVFIGYTEKMGLSQDAPLASAVIDDIPVTEAKLINSILEYESYFGKAPLSSFNIHIEETYQPGVAAPKTRSLVAQLTSPSTQNMYDHLQMFFANGGKSCYLISVGSTEETITKNKLLAGLEMASRYSEPDLLVIPQAVCLNTPTDAYALYRAALLQAGKLGNRFVLVDCYADNAQTVRSTEGIGDANLKYGAAYHPYLQTSLNHLYEAGTSLNIQLKRDRDADGIFEEESNPAYQSLDANLQLLIKAELDKFKVILSPSAAVAGVYATVDSARGIWKSPANVSLRLVSAPTQQIDNHMQEGLNIDETGGKSVNVIRSFPGKGVLIWGARTLAGNDNEWRYVSVKRFFMMLERDCKKALNTFVFEPNDANTWTIVRAMLENYLIGLWRQGAIAGAKPEQAFFVRIGLNQTMTATDILEGRLIVNMGIAPVRPAEFIILTFCLQLNPE